MLSNARLYLQPAVCLQGVGQKSDKNINMSLYFSAILKLYSRNFYQPAIVGLGNVTLTSNDVIDQFTITYILALYLKHFISLFFSSN